jgi:tetratricopeptide (TPR) repeat protein
MNTHNQGLTLPWVPRKVANQLYTKLLRAAAETDAVHVYLVMGKAGSGKTYLCRDLGVRLGSRSGYEPGQQGNIYWPGLLDMFDPSTNSNRGIETRITQGFDEFGFKFTDYFREREIYDLRYKTGYRGPSFEKQRRAIESAFSDGLAELGRTGFPVIPLDTVERLDSSTDPIQQEFNLQSDTASVIGWLTFQIKEMQRGAFIFFGRETRYFHKALREALKGSKQKGSRIVLEEIQLEALDPEDMDIFYQYRIRNFPQLEQILTKKICSSLEKQTGRNPLAMDMALQALLETHDPRNVLDALQEKEPSIDLLQQKLLEAYLNILDKPERKSLLHYLAVARNGLYDDLLHHLEPNNADRLVQELHKMEDLPFVKVRDVFVSDPQTGARSPRRTFFLHDEMYLLYDRQIEKEATITARIINTSQQIEKYYDEKIEAAQRVDMNRMKGERRSQAANDLIVESLIYRLRSDPNLGYQWFLFEEDRAIRGNISVGMDMQLRDAMGLFISTALEGNQEPGYSLTSPVDEENIRQHAPDLLERHKIDSVVLWVKRLSARGDNVLACGVAERYLGDARAQSKKQAAFLTSLAELELWYGQALMYSAENAKATALYQEVLTLLNPGRSVDELVEKIKDQSQDPLTIWRLCLVIGRTLNNLGYLCWRNLGRYRMAIQYFQQALPIFRVPESLNMPVIVNLKGLIEEIANTTDNMARVYSQLGYHDRAVDLAREALEQRNQLGLTYREALSENSLAIIQGNRGQYDNALAVLDDAMLEFRGAEAGRGVGLGSITRGMLFRRKAEDWRENNEPVSSAIHDTEMSEVSLREAASIFADDIIEPIHLVDVYNELGCCLRIRYLLQAAHLEGKNPGYLNSILTQGEASFNRSIKEAEKYGFQVEMLDSWQDLSVLYYRAGQFDPAQTCSNRVRDYISGISPDYLVREGVGLKKMDKETCTDAYYKILGQVEMMDGAIAYDLGRLKADKSSSPIDRTTYLETIQHYVFAVVYFTLFSNEIYSLQRTFGRMYKRFQKCNIELKKEITQDFIPRLVKKYNLPEAIIRDLMADILGFFQ